MNLKTSGNQAKRLAAIDLGTNSFHLAVAEVNPQTGQFKILDREKGIVRLGTGSTDMKYLSEDAIRRGLEVLAQFKAISESFQAPVRAIATSAVREATNQAEFIRKVKAQLGIKVEVASGNEEARLIYLGVLQALHVFDKRILLIDIGGGSTEFLLGERRNVLYANSLKLGAVRLTEHFFPDQKLTGSAIKMCADYVRGTMIPVKREIQKSTFECAVGTSGTILTIANMVHVSRHGTPPTRLNNHTISRDDLFDIVEEILESREAKHRLKLPGMDPARADIIAAGAIILRQVFQELNIPSLTVSESALREGIILDTIENRIRRQQAHHLTDLRSHSVLHLAENFRYEKKHSEHVTHLALQLFDQLRALHGLDDLEREYLEAASLLHEIGLFISHSQHHRHSYYLIRNADLPGFTESEKEIIANVARYHRKSLPKQKHPEFTKLSSDEQETISKLASLLRIADGLDRTHSSTVKDVECSLADGTVTIKLMPQGNQNPELEIWGALRKKDLFERAFDSNLEFTT